METPRGYIHLKAADSEKWKKCTVLCSSLVTWLMTKV